MNNTPIPTQCTEKPLLPPFQFSAWELAITLLALRSLAGRMDAREDYRNSAHIAAVLFENYFEEELKMDRVELWNWIGMKPWGGDLKIVDGVLPKPEKARAPLPDDITRQDVIDGLREIYRLAAEARRAEDPSFRSWPDMVKILDHLETHGLAPKEEA